MPFGRGSKGKSSKSRSLAAKKGHAHRRNKIGLSRANSGKSVPYKGHKTRRAKSSWRWM